mmetsp:Transcript_11510/g.25555  ORF Transcript_11510/g.25555 Transcript_11510/m.25555 type:complete len:311 (-) Transcript_11510:291-1223(-)
MGRRSPGCSTPSPPPMERTLPVSILPSASLCSSATARPQSSQHPSKSCKAMRSAALLDRQPTCTGTSASAAVYFFIASAVFSANSASPCFFRPSASTIIFSRAMSAPSDSILTPGTELHCCPDRCWNLDRAWWKSVSASVNAPSWQQAVPRLISSFTSTTPCLATLASLDPPCAPSLSICSRAAEQSSLHSWAAPQRSWHTERLARQASMRGSASRAALYALSAERMSPARKKSSPLALSHTGSSSVTFAPLDLPSTPWFFRCLRFLATQSSSSAALDSRMGVGKTRGVKRISTFWSAQVDRPPDRGGGT